MQSLHSHSCSCPKPKKIPKTAPSTQPRYSEVPAPVPRGYYFFAFEFPFEAAPRTSLCSCGLLRNFHFLRIFGDILREDAKSLGPYCQPIYLLSLHAGLQTVTVDHSNNFRPTAGLTSRCGFLCFALVRGILGSRWSQLSSVQCC